ncbi:MAG: hypothetical protein ACFCVA_09095 [Gammaproteobacteria bacterium]
MAFHQEPTQYIKTALSDLQGAWGNLRSSVVDAVPFPEWQRLLFHIDEAMSWESVRNLESMRKALILIQNIVNQYSCPEAVREGVQMVRDDFDEVLGAIAEGERI